MTLKTFGKFSDTAARPLIIVHGTRGAAVIYPPFCDQLAKPEANSKDGGSRKNYPVRWIGDAVKEAPCTCMGLWGSAQSVMRKVKGHIGMTRRV